MLRKLIIYLTDNDKFASALVTAICFNRSRNEGICSIFVAFYCRIVPYLFVQNVILESLKVLVKQWKALCKLARRVKQSLKVIVKTNLKFSKL